MTDNRTLATLNHPLEDTMLLKMQSLHTAPVTAAGDTIVLWHPTPITSCVELTGVTFHTQGETPPAYFDRDVSWSYDNAEYTPWETASAQAVKEVPVSVGASLWVRFRLTRRGIAGVPLYVREAVVTGRREFAGTGGVLTLSDEKPHILQPTDVFKVFSLRRADLYVKNVPAGTTVDTQFRYSGDNGRTWMPWTPLNDANLAATRFNPTRFSKFEFAFTKSGPGAAVVYDLELVGEFQNVTCGNRTMARLGLKSACAMDGQACSPDEGATPYNPLDWKPSEDASCIRGTYNPYALSHQKGQYVYVGNMLARMYGHAVSYFRVDPDANGTDFMLHEHQLYNIVDMKTLKAVVPDNQFPDGQLKIAHFDLSLLETFEVQVTKDEYKSVFGPPFRPTKNDILHFCELNLLFEVEKTIPHRGPFNTELYYRLVLRKYSQKANVSSAAAPAAAADLLQAMIKNTTFSDLFGDAVKDDQDQITKTQQQQPLSKLTGITVSPQVSVRLNNLTNSTLVISSSMYAIPVPLNKELAAVSYGGLDNVLTQADNRAVSMWFKTEKYDAGWTYTLFNNRDSVLGYGLTLHDGLLQFSLNSQTFLLDASDVREGIWYCALVNVDQRQRQLEMCLYVRQNETTPHKAKTSELVLLNGALHALAPQHFTHAAQACIGGVSQPVRRKTEYYVTNFRLYRQVVQDDARDHVLNAPVIRDADLLLFADNGDAKMTLPSMGNFGD